MPYLPDLIPQDQKIIPEYFHKQPVSKKKPKTDVGAILLGVLFLLIALYFIRYVGLGKDPVIQVNGDYKAFIIIFKRLL